MGSMRGLADRQLGRRSMGAVTRRALRVYAALSELRRNDEDVLDAVIPFFEPILEVMNGRLFDPRLFALGVQRLYRWRFTKDIAEQFIPRLQAKGLLHRSGRGLEAVYTVRFAPEDAPEALPISQVLNRIIDEFETFPPRVTDLLSYSRTRDELTDLLIRFLVSLDAYGEVAFAQEVQRLQLGSEEATVLTHLEEGGPPLTPNDRYMCARFVQHICRERPDYVSHLARLASIGLLTEVVEDFLKPVQTEQRVDLKVVVDAPLALDFLGCSGGALKDDVRRPPHRRHGYTHEAMARGEVMPDFVRAIAQDPENALEHAGIRVKPLSLEQYPNSHVYFDQSHYEDFFESVNWVQDIAPREHDATCLALLMRLRAGRHHSDLFRCGYIFVTRNPTFVRASRSYCLANRLITSVQQGPVIHQRQLATMAWLRTGLGAAEQIPRSHLLATCDRVLRVRMEVTDAVAAKLRQVTPERLEQFELLLLDHRSVRRLADETLNDEHVVTAENAERLLEAMRQAAIEEERQQFEARLRDEREKHNQAQRKARAAARSAVTERDTALAIIAQRKAADNAKIDSIVRSLSKLARRLESGTTAVLLLLGVLAVVQYFTNLLTGSKFWSAVLALAGLYGLYSLIMTALEKPKLGLATCLNWFSRKMLFNRLRAANLSDQFPMTKFDFAGGQITRKPEPTGDREQTLFQGPS